MYAAVIDASAKTDLSISRTLTRALVLSLSLSLVLTLYAHILPLFML